MKSGEYRKIVRVIVKSTLRKSYPGLKRLDDVANLIAKNIHARMYGANVDNVESPLWRDVEPVVTAKELLELDLK